MKGLSFDTSVTGNRLKVEGVEALKDSQIKGLSTLADSDTDRYAKLSNTKSLADQFLQAGRNKENLGNLINLQKGGVKNDFLCNEVRMQTSQRWFS